MTLREYFDNNQKGKAMYKCLHYFELYEKHLWKFINKKPKVLEIGVAQGGSLDMWENYFINGKIIGLDCNKWCKGVTDKKLYIGNQKDRKFLRNIVEKERNFDVIIDDGGHKAEQMVTSFQELYPALKIGGIYIIEDVCCSYWPEFQGGFKRAGTIIEISKELIDYVNEFSDKNIYTKNLTGIHFYNSMIVFEKGKKEKIKTKLIGEKHLKKNHGKFK